MLGARVVVILAPLVALTTACASKADRVSLSLPHEVWTLDPHAMDTLGSYAVAFHFYESLVTIDGNLGLQPSLASSWATPDPLTWVFRLRDGARFHSGKPLQADDVVYSIRRLIHDSSLAVSGEMPLIDDVQAIDPLTVEVRTKRPVNTLLHKLRFVAIVPRGAGPEALAERPDGTGPFAFVGWKKGERIEMHRNEAYWGQKPPLREVVLVLGRSATQAAEDLRSGRVQLAQFNSKKLAAAVAAAGRHDLFQRPSPFLKYIGFDFREDTPFASVKPNPFRSRAVREAVNLAIDRNRLLANLSSGAVPATQLVSPFVVGFNPGIPEPRYDPELAKTLLRRAGLPDGFQATLHARQILSEPALLLRDHLAQVGIRVDVRILPDAEFLRRLDHHETTLHLSRFGCLTGDAADVLGPVFHSADATRGLGLQNAAGYANIEVDHLIDQTEIFRDPRSRGEKLRKIMSIVMDDLVWVPLYFDHDVYAVDRDLRWQPRDDGFVLASEIGLRK